MTIIAARPARSNTPIADAAGRVHARTFDRAGDAGPGRLWLGAGARMMHGPRTLGTIWRGGRAVECT